MCSTAAGDPGAVLELALGPVNTGAGAGPGTPSRGEQPLMSTRRRLVLGR